MVTDQGLLVRWSGDLGKHKAMGEQRKKEFREQHDAQAACDSGCNTAAPHPIQDR